MQLWDEAVAYPSERGQLAEKQGRNSSHKSQSSRKSIRSETKHTEPRREDSMYSKNNKNSIIESYVVYYFLQFSDMELGVSLNFKSCLCHLHPRHFA